MSYSVADLFASLGIKVDAEDMTQLDAFTSKVNDAAAAVKSLVTQLNQLGSVKLPANVQTVKITQSTGTVTPQKTKEEREQERAQRAEDKAAKQKEREERKLTLAEQRKSQQFWNRVSGGSHGQNSLLRSVLGFTSLAGGLALLINTLKNWAAESMKAAASTEQFTTMANMSVDDLAKFRLMAAKAGTSEQEMMATLSGISQAREAAKYTGNWAGYQIPFGPVAPSKDPGKTLMDFISSAKNAESPADAQYWGEKIGIPRGVTFSLLEAQKRGALGDMPFHASKEQVDTVAELGTQWRQLMFTMNELKMVGLADIAKDLKPFIEFFQTLSNLLMVSHQARSMLSAGARFGPALSGVGMLGSLAASRFAAPTTVNQTNNFNLQDRKDLPAAGDAAKTALPDSVYRAREQAQQNR